MGIGFSHCGASWSYSGFGHFRRRLAREIGIALEAMEGFEEACPFCGQPMKGLPWGRFSDDIKPLLVHSDCDGEMSPAECARVAPRLRELVADWPDDYDKFNAFLLAEGMERAAEENEPLVFH